MLATVLAVVFACPLLVAAQGNVSFINPTTNGGSFLSMVGNGLGEPMNVSRHITSLSTL